MCSSPAAPVLGHLLPVVPERTSSGLASPVIPERPSPVLSVGITPGWASLAVPERKVSVLPPPEVPVPGRWVPEVPVHERSCALAVPVHRRLDPQRATPVVPECASPVVPKCISPVIPECVSPALASCGSRACTSSCGSRAHLLLWFLSLSAFHFLMLQLLCVRLFRWFQRLSAPLLQWSWFPSPRILL